ncbi:hypothetical protein [Nocardiopsis sp. YSL2]|uniref:hypothetical protein n=1 Tax=Nocardiopsis sp. YSL2 TaxID=2939492 RepID=UPI0026F424DC|nr:hypothetical protein [Nocardiopsis sp. YSL2]
MNPERGIRVWPADGPVTLQWRANLGAEVGLDDIIRHLGSLDALLELAQEVAEEQVRSEVTHRLLRMVADADRGLVSELHWAAESFGFDVDALKSFRHIGYPSMSVLGAQYSVSQALSGMVEERVARTMSFAPVVKRVTYSNPIETWIDALPAVLQAFTVLLPTVLGAVRQLGEGKSRRKIEDAVTQDLLSNGGLENLPHHVKLGIALGLKPEDYQYLANGGIVEDQPEPEVPEGDEPEET